MGATHTPGPWTFEGGNNENCEVQADGTTIDLTRCDRNTGNHVISRDEMEANARLVAAAPILMDACQQIMHLYKKDGHLLNFNVDIVRIAIAKATGGQS